MARPAPVDRDYAPTFAASFDQNAAPLNAAAITVVDLTAVNFEAQWAVCELYVMSVTAPGAGFESLVVRMQSAPTVDVILKIPLGQYVQFRGAFVGIVGSNVANANPSSPNLRITAFWQGGPA